MAWIWMALAVIAALVLSAVLAPGDARERARKGVVNDCQRDLLRPYARTGWKMRASRRRTMRS